MGEAGGPASIDGVVIVTPGGSACWLDDERFICQTVIGGQWVLAIITVSNGEVEEVQPPSGANYLAAGGGRWSAWLAGKGLFGSVVLPNAGNLAVGPDGTIAYCPVYQRGIGLTLNPPNGPEVDVPDAAVMNRNCQVLGPTSAIWRDYYKGIGVVGRAPLRPAVPPTGRLMMGTVDGEDWLVYWADGLGLVAHPDGAPDGYILETQGKSFGHDVRGVGDQLVVAWSLTQGEGPGDLVKRVLDRTAPRVPIAHPKPFPTPAPVPTISQPVWLGYFYSWSDRYGDNAHAPGNVAVIVEPAVVGRCPLAMIISPNCIDDAVPHWNRVAAVFVEGDPTTLPGMVSDAKRAMAGRSLLAKPVLALRDGWPPVAVPGADWIGVECYCDPTENSATFQLRIEHALATLPDQPIALIGEAYDRNHTETDIAKVAVIQDLWAHWAHMDRRILSVLLFSDGRAGGTRDHEVWRPWHRNFAAAVRTPIIPQPHPVPPHPVPPPTPFPAAKPHGGSMHVYLKLNGTYIGVDPTPVAGKSGDDAFPVYLDRPPAHPGVAGSWETWDLVQQPDGRFQATEISSNRVLSIQPDGSLQTRVAGTYGGYEQLDATTQPSPDALSLLYRVDSGKILGSPLVIEEAA